MNNEQKPEDDKEHKRIFNNGWLGALNNIESWIEQNWGQKSLSSLLVYI